MLTAGEALDIPEIPADSLQQQRIAALGISIGQFQKTLQGKALIEQQKLFVLGGMLYQGFNQKSVECPEDQCSDAEINGAYDVDGSLQRVLDTRRRRLEGNAHAKAKEFSERNKLKIAQRRDELELILLERKIKALDPDATDPVTDPDPEPMEYACEAPGCGKVFDKANKLNAHKMGAKH